MEETNKLIYAAHQQCLLRHLIQNKNLFLNKSSFNVCVSLKKRCQFVLLEAIVLAMCGIKVSPLIMHLCTTRQMKYACNPTLSLSPLFPWSKAVQMAVSQRLTAVVLKLLANELFYCLFPSLCTDGRILSTSFYCYWIDSGLCMHCVSVFSPILGWE